MDKKKIFFIVLIILVVLAIPIIVYSIFFHSYTLGNPTEWGVFGDFYSGILNPIITAITTALLIYITFLLNKKDKEHNKDLIIIQLKKQIIDKLVTYQQEIIAIRSQFDVKQDLIKYKIAKNKNDYNNLSFIEKGEKGNYDDFKKKDEELYMSVKSFYAGVFFTIAEISVYFKYFDTSYSILLTEQVIKQTDLNCINTELMKLESFIKQNLNNKTVNIPTNFTEIEKEISKIITLISN